MRIYRKLTVMLFAVAIAAGITCHALAQDATSGATKIKNKQDQLKNPDGKVPELTKEQQDKIDQLHMTFAKDLIGLKNQIAEKKAHLKTVSMVDQPDMAAVNKTIDELFVLKADIAKKKAAMIQEIRKTLTPEQRLHFDMQHDRKCKGRCDGSGSGGPFMGKGPHGMGPGCKHMVPGCMQKGPGYGNQGENCPNKKESPPSEEKK